MAWDWNPYLVGGGTRPDAISGMADPFQGSLEALFASAPPEIQNQLRLTSGYRSNERQAQLWEEALAKYGSPEAARKWVAPPGSSQHNHGTAADLKYLSPEAQAWAHENAAKYGLYFPLSNEPWHIEPVGSRGGVAATASAAGNGQNALAGYQPPQPQNALAPEQPVLRLNNLALTPYRMT